MSDFDLAALEKVLSTKSRKQREELTLKPNLSKQDLYDTVKRLAEEYRDVYHRRLRTRSEGVSYLIEYGELYRDGYRVGDDIEKVPRAVFQRLIANGRRHLKGYHDMINTVVMQIPTLALEANLEGKTGREVLNFVYTKRLGQIEQLLKERVSVPHDESIYWSLPILIKPPLGQQFTITVNCWNGRSPSIKGVELRPSKEEGTVRLVDFLTYFEQVIDGINRQLDAIKIRKEVT